MRWGVFKKAVFHYPDNAQALAQIYKEIIAFRCAAVVKYIESLNLNDWQTETLYASLAEDIAQVKQKMCHTDQHSK